MSLFLYRFPLTLLFLFRFRFRFRFRFLYLFPFLFRIPDSGFLLFQTPELSSGRGRFIDMSNSTKRASRRGEKWKDDRSKEKSFNTTKKLNFTSQRV